MDAGSSLIQWELTTIPRHSLLITCLLSRSLLGKTEENHKTGNPISWHIIDVHVRNRKGNIRVDTLRHKSYKTRFELDPYISSEIIFRTLLQGSLKLNSVKDCNRKGTAQSVKWTAYGLKYQDSIPESVRNFSLYNHVQTVSGTHQSYPVGTKNSFFRDKAGGARSWLHMYI
jgi:hypothetical protein